MAWGVWNKIKKGFQKVGCAIVKGAKWVNDKIIKQFKPVVKKVVGTVANAFVPGSGTFVSNAVDTVSDGKDTVINWVNKKKKIGWFKII